MTNNTKNNVYAQDILISLASTLPRNLLIEGTEDNFSFLLKLSKEQLETLAELSKPERINPDIPLRLKFFTAQAGSASYPTHVSSLEKVRWELVKRIDLRADSPIEDCDETPNQYIYVVLTIK